MQDDFSIRFERSGGFAGMITEVALDTRTMPLDEAKHLRELIREANLKEMQLADANEHLRDGFQYKITMVSAEQAYTISMDESQVPDGCRPLIDWLTRKARDK